MKLSDLLSPKKTAPVVRPDDRPTGPKGSGPVLPPSRITFGILPNWLRKAFGLQAGGVPTGLGMPDAQPVVELYQPELKEIVRNGNLGSNMTFTVPPGEEWEIVSARITVTSDATVQNRALLIRLFDQFNLSIFDTAGNFNQVATTTIQYSVGPHGVVGSVLTVGAVGIDGVVLIPTPIGQRIMEGGAFDVELNNAAGGDNITGVRLVVRKWPSVLMAR